MEKNYYICYTMAELIDSKQLEIEDLLSIKMIEIQNRINSSSNSYYKKPILDAKEVTELVAGLFRKQIILLKDYTEFCDKYLKQLNRTLITLLDVNNKIGDNLNSLLESDRYSEDQKFQFISCKQNIILIESILDAIAAAKNFNLSIFYAWQTVFSDFALDKERRDYNPKILSSFMNSIFGIISRKVTGNVSITDPQTIMNLSRDTFVNANIKDGSNYMDHIISYSNLLKVVYLNLSKIHTSIKPEMDNFNSMIEDVFSLVQE